MSADHTPPPSPPPSDPAFWDARYLAQRTPWDYGRVPLALTRWLASHPGRGATVLIPGCGSGYEIIAFAAAGWRVTALDFSPAAVARARAVVGPALAERVLRGDFFTEDFSDAPFDLIYERTFLCALPPELWPKLAERTAALLKPDGMLAGFYFFGEKEDGPPFGLMPGEDEQILGRTLMRTRDEPIPKEESLPLFAGRERWQEWRRASGPG